MNRPQNLFIKHLGSLRAIESKYMCLLTRVSSQCSLFTCYVPMIALSNEAIQSSLIDGWSLVFEKLSKPSTTFTRCKVWTAYKASLLNICVVRERLSLLNISVCLCMLQCCSLFTCYARMATKSNKFHWSINGRSSYLKNSENYRRLLPLMFAKYKDSAGYIVLSRSRGKYELIYI